jgi:flavodoxin
MKTLKEILQLEVYEPKSPDEKRFKDKHVVVKHKDANGNDDDLFNAKNIKTVDREPKHGYNPGEDEKVYEEVEELDEKFMNVYAVATAQVKKKYGLKGKNVDLTDKQTVEAHALAKKIAKKMGINLKESAKLNAARVAFAAASPMGPTKPGIPPYGKPGSAKAREAAKTAAAEAAEAAATAPTKSTQERMIKKLNLPRTISSKYPEKMTGPEDEGPDGRYGTGPQMGGVYKDPKTGQTFTGKWPGGIPPTSPRKPRSKK